MKSPPLHLCIVLPLLSALIGAAAAWPPTPEAAPWPLDLPVLPGPAAILPRSERQRLAHPPLVLLRTNPLGPGHTNYVFGIISGTNTIELLVTEK